MDKILSFIDFGLFSLFTLCFVLLQLQLGFAIEKTKKRVKKLEEHVGLSKKDEKNS